MTNVIEKQKRDAMEIERLNITTDQITGEPIDNCVILVSNGTVKKLQMSPFMELNVKSVGGKITIVEQVEKHRF